MKWTPSTYRHGLRVRHHSRRRGYWRYQLKPYEERRNCFRSGRSARNRNVQTTNRNYFRYHFVLPTNEPLKSIQNEEKPNKEQEEDCIAFVIGTPEATETDNADIFSVTILRKEDLPHKITADIA